MTFFSKWKSVSIKLEMPNASDSKKYGYVDNIFVPVKARWIYYFEFKSIEYVIVWNFGTNPIVQNYCNGFY